MKSINHIRPTEARWRRGAPPTVDAATVAIDCQIVRYQMRCPRCRRRGLRPVPQHRGSTGYRVLGICRCGETTEA